MDIKEVERGAIEMNDPVYLSIVSGKGGVGKSTVAANLAVALAKKGYRVGLIDADIYGFSVPSLMDAREEPKSEEGKMRPIRRLGVRLMSSGFLRNDNQPVAQRGAQHVGEEFDRRFGVFGQNGGVVDRLLFARVGVGV